MTQKKREEKHGSGLGVMDRKKVERPKKYQVVMYNDDYTPMNFVVAVLIAVFKKSEDVAKRIMLQVHESGKGIAGVYTKEIADTKVVQAMNLAKQHEHPFLIEANKKAGWNYNWDYSESCQFTKYKIGQYYTWHTDTITNVPNGKIRKISMSCVLSDSNEYEGGEFEFDFRNYNPNMRDEHKHVHRINNKLPKGSIIVFPSFIWHRVKPVTSGTRYSLVSWHVGDPFK